MSEKLMFISAFQYNAIYSKDSGIAITTPVIESDKYEALQSQLDEANKVIEDLLVGNDRMFIQLSKQKRNLVYIHNSDEPSVTKDNLRAEALVIASNIGHELDGENFWNIKPSIKRARAYQEKYLKKEEV